MQTLDLAVLGNILPANAFKQMSAFGALSDSFVEQILAAGELLKLSEGETLYHQGERAECFYVILQGHLTLYQDSEAGREVTHTSGEGESVGFPAMLAMRPRLLSGEAANECVVLKVSSQALARLQELDSQQFGIFHQPVPGHEPLPQLLHSPAASRKRLTGHAQSPLVDREKPGYRLRRRGQMPIMTETRAFQRLEVVVGGCQPVQLDRLG